MTKLHKIDFSNKLGKNYDNVVINKSFSMLFSVLINERAHTVAHFDKLAYLVILPLGKEYKCVQINWKLLQVLRPQL